jgi:RNA polymerase sigma-70 factor (ECF subfamily)
MKRSILPVTILIAVCAAFSVLRAHAQETIESLPPVVVKTVPVAGADNVTPGVVEVKVTFSKEMTDGSWSWSTAWQNSTGETVGKPRYDADHKTCVLKVKLEPNTTYAFWVNSQRFTGFRDSSGHAAVPYLLAFKTKAK